MHHFSPYFRAVMSLLVIILIVLMVASCASPPDFNAAGGYTPACGDLPGLLGDDC